MHHYQKNNKFACSKFGTKKKQTKTNRLLFDQKHQKIKQNSCFQAEKKQKFSGIAREEPPWKNPLIPIGHNLPVMPGMIPANQ